MSVSVRRSTPYRPDTLHDQEPVFKDGYSGKKPSSTRVVAVGCPIAARLRSGRRAVDVNTTVRRLGNFAMAALSEATAIGAPGYEAGKRLCSVSLRQD